MARITKITKVVRVCLFAGLTDSNEVFKLLEFVSQAGGIGCPWHSDDNVFVDIYAPTIRTDTVVWSYEFARQMTDAGFNAVSAPAQ